MALSCLGRQYTHFEYTHIMLYHVLKNTFSRFTIYSCFSEFSSPNKGLFLEPGQYSELFEKIRIKIGIGPAGG